MDIYCPKCAEPTDQDELHYVDGKTYDQAAKAFRLDGCKVLGFTCNPRTTNSFKAQASYAMFELLGDDMDGATSLMDDFESMGYFE